MLILPWIFKLNNYISKNFYRPPPLVGVYWLLLIILSSYYFTTQEVFMDYLSVFIEMLQAKNLAPNTIRGYQTYSSARIYGYAGALPDGELRHLLLGHDADTEYA